MFFFKSILNIIKKKQKIESILESDPSIMPKEEICDQCPNTEYKSLKNRYKRATTTTNTTLSPTLASSIMPASLYTCKKPVDYSKNPDYIQCFSCLAEGDESNESECKNPANNTKIAHKWCNSITQKCFSKSASVNGTTQEFSRGCASLNELGKDFADKAASTSSKATCVNEGQGSETCILLCDTSLCNKDVEIVMDVVVDDETSDSVATTTVSCAMILALSLVTMKMIL